MLSLIISFLIPLLSGFAASLLISTAMWLIDRAGPEDGDIVAGRIKVNRTVILLLSAVPLASGLTAVHCYVTFFPHPYTLLIAFSLFAVAWCLLVTLRPNYDVTWTAHGLTGPTSYGIWPFGPSRGSIRFADIAEIGEDWAQSLYVADATGQRVRWNRCYSGFGAAVSAVEQARPDLFIAPREDNEDWA